VYWSLLRKQVVSPQVRFGPSRFALTQSRFVPTLSQYAPTQSRFARSFINANYGVVSEQICFISYISFLNIPFDVVTGRFANVSLVRQRPVRQRMKSIRHCPGSVRICQFTNVHNIFWKRSEMYLQITKGIKCHLCKTTWVFKGC